MSLIKEEKGNSNKYFAKKFNVKDFFMDGYEEMKRMENEKQKKIN